MQMRSNYGHVLHMNMLVLVTKLVSVIKYFHVLNIYHCFDKLTCYNRLLTLSFTIFFPLTLTL